jgi:uncharacterized membrane protein YjdF
MLLSVLALALVMLLLQHIALAEFLYWKWWWFDNVMHFLGGVLIGGIALVTSDILKTPRLLTFLVALLGIGIGWEVFEWSFGLYDGAWDAVDTSTDLIMDTLGALMVYSGIKLWK